MRRLNENIRLVSSMAQLAATAPQTPGPVPAQAAPARPFQRRYSPRHPYGALDLGTHNCRLLVAEPAENGFPLSDPVSRAVRLGDGLDPSGPPHDAASDHARSPLSRSSNKLARTR